MKRKRVLALCISLALVVAFFVGCSPSGGTDAGTSGTTTPAPAASDDGGGTDIASGEPIRIGIVGPLTGYGAGFGEGEEWINEFFKDYVNNEMGGIEVDGEKRQVEYFFYDTESDSTKATEYTQKCIQENKVHLMMGHHMPETVNTIAAVCERYEVPCVTVDAPVEAWTAEGPYEWSFHSHWSNEDGPGTYMGLWKAVGLEPSSDIKIGVCASNDADGETYVNDFLPYLVEAGYTSVYTGSFPNGTQDFTEYIQTFKDEDCQIMSGLMTNPDFSTLWRQCKQMDFNPQMVTFEKCLLFQSDAEAVGEDIADGLSAECWWHPSFPFQSSLTGETAQELADRYTEDSGRVIPAPVAAKYYNWEIVIDALTRAGTLDKVAIRDAVAATDLDTIFGHVKYLDDHSWHSPVVAGQWFVEDGKLVQKIVDNTMYPEIALTGDPKLL